MNPPITPSTQQHTVLIDLARRWGWTRGAEIGVLKGKTLKLLLDQVPALHMIAVDQWQQLPPVEIEGYETYEKFDMAAAESLVRAVAAEFPNHCTILKGDSVAMAHQVRDESLDFVFIDALHTTEATRANIHAWAPKVTRTGWILGHDWWWPSVRAALDEALPGWHEHPESVWSLPKVRYREAVPC